MIARVSDLAGGGQVYAPAMMEFDGSTGYYSKSSVTTSGNKLTLVFRVNRTSFTGGAEEMVFRAGASYVRVLAAVYPSDHATTEWRNKLKIFVKNTANTTICHVLSIPDLADGETHTVLFSYDGDAGAATLIVDGVDAIDTGAGIHTITTGTVSSGSTTFSVAANHVGNLTLDGQLGFVGFDDVYLTNWRGFMRPDGQPKSLDESGWTEWGAQPLFWNPHGDMVNNLGSAGAMTKNGIINVGNGGTNPPHRGIATIGDVNNDNLPFGVVGWANAQRYEGVHDPYDNGVILDYWTPINSAVSDDSWTPQNDFEGHVRCASGVLAGLASSAGYNRKNSGNAYHDSSYAVLISCLNAMPAYQLSFRRHYFEWAQMSASAPTTNDGINYLFNYVDSSNFNYVNVKWTGTIYEMLYVERVADVDTVRVTHSWSSTVDHPVKGWVMVDDWGDNLILRTGGFETDAGNADYDIERSFYSAVGRANKDGRGFSLTMSQVTTEAFGIRGLSIRDI